MQVTFDPHNKEDIALISLIVGKKGVIISQPTAISGTPQDKRNSNSRPIEIQAAILEAVKNGHNTPKKLRQNLSYTFCQLQRATRQLLKQRALTSTGHTTCRRFHAN